MTLRDVHEALGCPALLAVRNRTENPRCFAEQAVNAALGVERVKRLLLQAAQETEGVATEPRPLPLVIETTESWITFKMVNFLTDYGAQFTIGDAFQTRALALLAEHDVKLAAPRIHVLPP